MNYRYIVIDKKGKVFAEGASNYEAWKNAFDDYNLWFDNIESFRSGFVSRGYKCKKTIIDTPHKL